MMKGLEGRLKEDNREMRDEMRNNTETVVNMNARLTAAEAKLERVATEVGEGVRRGIEDGKTAFVEEVTALVECCVSVWDQLRSCRSCTSCSLFLSLIHI